MDFQNLYQSEQDRRVLEFLGALSYRSHDLGQYLDAIACGVSRLLQSDWSIVTVCQGETGRVVANSLGLGEGDNGFLIHGTLVNEISETGQSRFIEDARQSVRACKPPEDYLGYLGVPLRTAQGIVSGTICSFFRQPRQFTEAEIRTVELFAERAATAIDNYRLYQQQQKFNELLEQEVANRTEELRIAQAKLVERERLAAIGEFAAMIVHEVRNPLTTIMLGLNHAIKKLAATSSHDRLALSLSEASRLEQLLNEILLYAKPQVLQLSRIQLDQFLLELLEQMREMPEAAERHIEFTPATASGVEILGDANKLKQVLINLLRNACEAIAPGDTVQCAIKTCAIKTCAIETCAIETRAIERGAHSNHIVLCIHNGGTPIPPDILPKLTEPFCSTKPSGTGLGLAIVKRIVTAHGGELVIESSAIAGTTVQVQLPIVSPSCD
jgi:signal transduction histidine kinase